jgi:hypothetical protein
VLCECASEGAELDSRLGAGTPLAADYSAFHAGLVIERQAATILASTSSIGAYRRCRRGLCPVRCAPPISADGDWLVNVSDFDRKMGQAYLDLSSGYFQPIHQASQAIVRPCKDVDPGTDAPDCANLVEVISSSEYVLIDSLGRIVNLLSQAPPDIGPAATSNVELLINTLN